MSHLLVVAEFVFSEAGEIEFLAHRDRTLAEVRATDGCLQAVVWSRPDRRYRFSTLWEDDEAVSRWVANEFHRTVVMPGFRSWCTEGCFGEYRLARDHERARRCPACRRWTKGLPGWSEQAPGACAHCGAALALPLDR